MELSTNVFEYEVKYFTSDEDKKNCENIKTAYISSEQMLSMAKKRNAREMVSIPGIGAFPPEFIRSFSRIDSETIQRLEKPIVIVDSVTSVIEDGKEYSVTIFKVLERGTKKLLKTYEDKKLVREFSEEEKKRHKELSDRMAKSENPMSELLSILQGDDGNN